MPNPFKYLQFAMGDQFHDRRGNPQGSYFPFPVRTVERRPVRPEPLREEFACRRAIGDREKAKLMEDGHIEQAGGQYVVADPFFAQFLRTM